MMLTGEGRSLCSWEGKRKNSNTPQCVWSTIQGNQFFWKKPKTRRQRDSETPWPHYCTLPAVHPAKKPQSQRDQQTTAMKPQQARKNRIFLQNGASFDRIQGKELRYEWNFMENFYKTVFWSRKSPILYNMSLPLLSARCGLTAGGDAAVFVMAPHVTKQKAEYWKCLGAAVPMAQPWVQGEKGLFNSGSLMWFP